MSGCIPHLSISHSPVFLLNSCLDLFSAPQSLEDPFSRSYGVSLPSSLTMNLPTPRYPLPGHVCPFAVRVTYRLSLADFLGSLITRAIAFPRRGQRTIRFGSGHVLHCVPHNLHPSTGDLRYPAAVSLLRLRVALYMSDGMLTVFPSASPLG